MEVNRLEDLNKAGAACEEGTQRRLESLGKAEENLRYLRSAYNDATRDLKINITRNKN